MTLPDLLAIAAVLCAALFPGSPPSAVGIADPTTFTSPWAIRPFVLNVPELAAAAAVAAMVLSGRWRHRSSFDPQIAVFAAAVIGLQLLAVQRNAEGLQYVPLDAERVLLLLLGYLLMSRMDLDVRRLKLLAGWLGGALLLAFGYLVLRYGVLGTTEFRTTAGRTALIITEDTLLVALPLTCLWGLMVDGLLNRRRSAATVALTAVVSLVNLLSLRRGGLIFTALALGVRSLRGSRRVLLGGLAAVLVAFAVGVALGPLRPVYNDLRFAVETAALQGDDRSGGQRRAELENFARNVHGAGDLLFGKGLGAVWNAEVRGPTDIAAFGGGETPYVRVGWHVYGLDWLYKLGALGTLLTLFLLVQAALRLRRAMAAARDRVMASLGWSLGIAAATFVVFAFTNPRLAFMAGVCAGLASHAADLVPPGERVRPAPPE